MSKAASIAQGRSHLFIHRYSMVGKVAIDRKRMILRSFGETRCPLYKLPDQSYVSYVHQEEDCSIKGNRLRRSRVPEPKPKSNSSRPYDPMRSFSVGRHSRT